jgi:AraC-like DNA-binding protein
MRPCVLRYIEAVEARSGHVFTRHTHDTYGIGLITRGAQRSWSGRGTVEAGRGNIITCNPGEVHDGAPIDGTREWRMLYLAPHVVGAIVTDIREGGSAEFEFINPVIDSRSLAEMFQAAYAAMTERHADAGRAHECLLLLLASLLRKKRSATSAAPPEMARAKALIDDDPTVAIPLAELSRETGLSRFQVVRGFCKLTGFTPHAYIVQRRLDAARTLLAEGKTLVEVSGACGFSDQSHFHRTFVRRYGITPSAYLQALR